MVYRPYRDEFDNALDIVTRLSNVIASSVGVAIYYEVINDWLASLLLSLSLVMVVVAILLAFSPKKVFQLALFKYRQQRQWSKKNALQKAEQKESFSESVYIAARNGDIRALAYFIRTHNQSHTHDPFWSVSNKAVEGLDPPPNLDPHELHEWKRNRRKVANNEHDAQEVGWTCFHVAAARGNSKCLEMLIGAAAINGKWFTEMNETAKFVDGKKENKKVTAERVDIVPSPYEVALLHGCGKCVKLLERYGMETFTAIDVFEDRELAWHGLSMNTLLSELMPGKEGSHEREQAKDLCTKNGIRAISDLREAFSPKGKLHHHGGHGSKHALWEMFSEQTQEINYKLRTLVKRELVDAGMEKVGFERGRLDCGFTFIR